MGNNGSPRSNSTQTVAPTRGKALPIFFEQLVDGKQGSAQPSTSSPAKSGATNWIRPSPSGSIVLNTIAQYFPKYFALTLASASGLFTLALLLPAFEYPTFSRLVLLSAQGSADSSRSSNESIDACTPCPRSFLPFAHESPVPLHS